MDTEIGNVCEQTTTNRAGFFGWGRIEENPLTYYLLVILCDILSKQQVNSAGKLITLKGSFWGVRNLSVSQQGHYY